MPLQRFIKRQRTQWSMLLLIMNLLCACQPATADSLAIVFSAVQPVVSPTPSPLLPIATSLTQNKIVLPDTSSPERLALIERGYQLYLQQYCGACHSLTAVETKGIFGPPHDEMAALAQQRLQDPNYTGTATTAADYLRESLVDPGIYLVEEYLLSPHRMPTYAHLPEEDIAALIEMLLQQR